MDERLRNIIAISKELILVVCETACTTHYQETTSLECVVSRGSIIGSFTKNPARLGRSQPTHGKIDEDQISVGGGWPDHSFKNRAFLWSSLVQVPVRELTCAG
jgi:hypothetical protein